MNRAGAWFDLAVAALLLAGCAASPEPASDSAAGSREARAAAERITGARLSLIVEALASDAFEGRGPASAGDRLTQQYLIEQLEAAGLEPGASLEPRVGAARRGWLQEFEIVGITAKVPERWRFERAGADAAAGAGDSLALAYREQFIATSGVQRESARIDAAEVVFVGYGIQAPEYDWDDFKQRDLRGKVLLFLNNDPDWDPALFAGETRLYYGRWSYKYEIAARLGAVGAIVIHTTPSAGYPWQVVQSSWSGEQFELPARDEPRLEIAAWVTEDAAEQLARLAGRDLAQLVESAKSRNFEPVPLGVTTSLALESSLARTRTANVLGELRGSDPQRADEVVVYTAHHDHLGVGEPDADGDRIYNGALDNAAGVAQVLAIAEAFRALPVAPRRSLLFLLVAAEEQGLLGSKYYAAHPSFAPGRVAANINFDGGNIWGRSRDISVIGLGKSSLDAVVTRIAASQARSVKPDPFPDRGYYYRSDQFSFAKIGVPAVFFDTGTDFVGRPAGWGKQQIEDYEAKRYHQPSDEIDASWSFEGMVEDAQLGFWVGLEVADADALPTWNPGDEFEPARRAALNALSAV
jgi:Zn-dependent M28 family amino/carboxypeptidase